MGLGLVVTCGFRVRWWNGCMDVVIGQWVTVLNLGGGVVAWWVKSKKKNRSKRIKIILKCKKKTC